MTKKDFVAKANVFCNGLFHHAVIQAAVRATIPGRQQKKNLEPALILARKAGLRTLKRLYSR